MYESKTVLAVIPARGGSKGLPRKNIKLLGGRPLIAWTIEAALECGYIDRVVVSTEDEEIADVAKRWGAEVPFMRPAQLATDEAKGMEVLLHAMGWLEAHQERFDLVLLLQPTSPLRSAEDIRNALALFTQKRAEAVVSVCESEHSPLWMGTLGEDLNLRDFLPREVLKSNRQELQRFYRLNGALYLATWEFLKKNRNFFGEKTYAYIMPRERSVDIDTELDLLFAEFLLERKRRQSGNG